MVAGRPGQALGIGIVSRYAVEAELATGVLRALPIAGWTLMRPVSMVYRSQKYFSPVGERFRDFAKSYGAQHLERAHAFFERYGGMAVVLTRFVPIIRTFVPFVAGAGAMRYPVFALYNIAGGVLWVGICVGAGYLVALGIVAVSMIPMLVEWIKHKRKGQRG